VTVVMAGDAHVVALTRDGTLFTWGSNAKSQLGVGKHVVRQATPTHLQGAITGIQFVGVATGGTHTLAVSRSGEVYCWGNNDHGQVRALFSSCQGFNSSKSRSQKVKVDRL
jgi:alpha-tubulin suppressor-like RCC1 family protein